MVGVGILWRQDYTEQFVDEHDRPYDCYHEYRYDVLEDTGVVVTVPIQELQVRVKVWKCTAYGNVPLYLLDTLPARQSGWNITAQLYGGLEEERVAQEMILGIGACAPCRRWASRWTSTTSTTATRSSPAWSSSASR